MPSPTRYYLTVAQTEELLDILVPMAGGLAGYTQDGRRSSYVFPGGLHHEFVGNENIAQLADVWGLDVRSLQPSLSVLDGLAHMQAMYACSDALFKAIEGGKRGSSGYVELAESFNEALRAAGVSLSLTDPPVEYWSEVLSVPSVRTRLESTWTYPYDASKRTDAVNAIMSVIGAMGVDIYQPEKTPRVAKQIADDKRKDPSNPYRITDTSMLHDALFKMAEKCFLGGLGAREFIKNVHHQFYTRNIALAHKSDLVDAGVSSTHPAFMTMQTTRSLMQCYMAISQGQVETASQSIAALEGVERPLGRSYVSMSSMKEHLLNRAYSLSRVFNDRVNLAKAVSPQEIDTIRRSFSGAKMAFNDAISASSLSLVTSLSNLEAMNAWANPGLYSPDLSARQSVLKKATERVASLEGNWAGALLNQQQWTAFASQSAEYYQVWLSSCDKIKASDPSLFSRMQEEWSRGYRGDTLLLGLDIGKASTAQKTMLESQLSTLRSEIAFKTRGLWAAPETLPAMIEFAKESAEWASVAEQMKLPVPDGSDYRKVFPFLVAYHDAAAKTIEFSRNVMPGIAKKAAETKPVAPVADKPAETKPAAPVADKPAETKPAAPAADKPAETKPVPPVADKPAETKPVAPVADKPAETKPAAPVADKPAEAKPAAPAADKPAETKPAAPVVDKPAETKPAAPVADKPAEAKPAAPVVDKPAEAKPAAPVVDKPAETKPAAPVVDKPAETKPAAPVVDKPAEAKPVEPASKPLPVSFSDDPKTALLQIYEKVTELAFNREGDLVAADELDWFSSVWGKVVGDLDAMSPEEIEGIYPEVIASFGHMMQFKARPALRRWYDESSEKSIQIESFSELAKRFNNTVSALPPEQAEVLRKVWKAGLRHVIRDDGQVPEYVAMGALTKGLSAAEPWVQSLRKADLTSLIAEYGTAFTRYDSAAKAWSNFAQEHEQAGPALSVHWDLAVNATMWFSLPKIQHGLTKLEAVIADPAMRAQIMKFETDVVSTSPWNEKHGELSLSPLDVPMIAQENPSPPRIESEEQGRKLSMSM